MYSTSSSCMCGLHFPARTRLVSAKVSLSAFMPPPHIHIFFVRLGNCEWHQTISCVSLRGLPFSQCVLLTHMYVLSGLKTCIFHHPLCSSKHHNPPPLPTCLLQLSAQKHLGCWPGYKDKEHLWFVKPLILLSLLTPLSTARTSIYISFIKSDIALGS